MLKNLLKNKDGNALVTVVMVMAVVMIVAASFMANVTASTKIDQTVSDSEQAYLVAKSGMEIIEKRVNALSYIEMCNQYKDKDISGDVGELGNFTGKVTLLDPVTGTFNIECTGIYNGSEFKLYKYKTISPTTTTTTETTTETTTDATTETTTAASPGGTVKKSANIQYNSSGNLTAGVIGPSSYLFDNPTGNITGQNAKGPVGSVAALTNISFNNSSGGEYAGIFSKYSISFAHGQKIKGDVYAGEDIIANSTASGVKMEGNMFAKGDIELTSNGFEMKGDVYAGGNFEMGRDNIVWGDIVCEGDAVLNGGAQIRRDPTTNNGGNIYVQGDLIIDFSNSCDIMIDGGIYVSGSIVIEGSNNKRLIDPSIIFSLDGFIESTGAFTMPESICYSDQDGSAGYQSEFTCSNCGYTADNLEAFVWNGCAEKHCENADKLYTMFGGLQDKIDQKLKEEISVPTKPVTSLPAGWEGYKIYNSLDDLEADGYKITESCVIKFDLVNYDRPLTIDVESSSSDRSIIDIVFDCNQWTTMNRPTFQIRVNDHDHRDLIRLFFKENMQLKLESNTWAFVPYNGTSTDYDYVPNLYVFSLQPESSVMNVGQVFGQEARACFPGYWLTPNLSLTMPNNGGMNGTEETPVTSGNYPTIHGMLTTDATQFTNSQKIAIKYHDPDEVVGQQWTFEDAIRGIYTMPIS